MKLIAVLFVISVFSLRVTANAIPSEDDDEYKTEYEINKEFLPNGIDVLKLPDDLANGAPTVYQKWPSNADGVVIVPYTFVDDHGAKSQIEEAIKAFNEEWTCGRLVPKTTEIDYITFTTNRGCSSYIGKIGGSQPVSILYPGCERRGTIQHEILHALGFHHEQVRPDRDNFVKINFENIRSGVERNFEKISLSEYKDLGTLYDYGSVMHYGGRDFTINGQYTIETLNEDFQDKIGQRIGISITDIYELNNFYGCSVPSTPAPTPIPTTGGFPFECDFTTNCGFKNLGPDGRWELQQSDDDGPHAALSKNKSGKMILNFKQKQVRDGSGCKCRSSENCDDVKFCVRFDYLVVHKNTKLEVSLQYSNNKIGKNNNAIAIGQTNFHNTQGAWNSATLLFESKCAANKFSFKGTGNKRRRELKLRDLSIVISDDGSCA